MNQQLVWVGMNARVHLEAGGNHAGSDVGAVLHAQAAVNAIAPCLSASGQIQPGKAIGRKGIAGNRFHQTHIQIARGFALPAGMGKIFDGTDDFQRPLLHAASACGDAQRVQQDRVARQLQRRLQVTMNRRLGRGGVRGRAAHKIQIADSGLDAIALLVTCLCARLRIHQSVQRGCARHVGHAQRGVAGGEVKREEAILKVKGGGAILVVQRTLLYLYAVCLQIKESVQRRLAGLSRLARLRLVGRAVGVNDQMQLGTGDFQVAQQDARSEKAQNADLHPKLADLGVRSFACSFEAVDDQSVGFGLKMKEIPVEGSDFNPSAGGALHLVHQITANKVFKAG